MDSRILVFVVCVFIAIPVDSTKKDGSYSFSYESSSHSETIGTENGKESIKGSYTFTGDDGVTHIVNYVADENGFQPMGDHLPIPPPPHP